MKIWRILVYWIAIFLSIIISSVEYYNFEFSNYIEKIQKLQIKFWDKEISYTKEWNIFKTKISPFFLKLCFCIEN